MSAVNKLREVKSDLISECKYIKETDLESKSKEELIEIIKGFKQHLENWTITEIDSELDLYM